MSAYDVKTDWSSSDAPGASDFNRMEFNMYLIAVQDGLSGTFNSVTTGSSTTLQDIATMTITFPQTLVDLGYYVAFHLPSVYYRRYRIGTSVYSEDGSGYLSKVAVATSITITVQGRGYSFGGSTYASIQSKYDPEIRVSFYTS